MAEIESLNGKQRQDRFSDCCAQVLPKAANVTVKWPTHETARPLRIDGCSVNPSSRPPFAEQQSRKAPAMDLDQLWRALAFQMGRRHIRYDDKALSWAWLRPFDHLGRNEASGPISAQRPFFGGG